MREKVEAQGGVSDPARGERESPAEILSGALLGAQSKDQLQAKREDYIRSNHA